MSHVKPKFSIRACSFLLALTSCAAALAETAAVPQKPPEHFTLAGVSIGMTHEEVAGKLAVLGTGSHKIQSLSYDQKAFFQFVFEGESPYGITTAVDVALRFKEDIRQVCDGSNGTCQRAVPSYVTRVELRSEDPSSTAIREKIVEMYGPPTRKVTSDPVPKKATFPPNMSPQARAELEALMKQAASQPRLQEAPASATAAAKASKKSGKPDKATTGAPPAEAKKPAIEEWCLSAKCDDDDAEVLRYTNGTATLIGRGLEREIFTALNPQPTPGEKVQQ